MCSDMHFPVLSCSTFSCPMPPWRCLGCWSPTLGRNCSVQNHWPLGHVSGYEEVGWRLSRKISTEDTEQNNKWLRKVSLISGTHWIRAGRGFFCFQKLKAGAVLCDHHRKTSIERSGGSDKAATPIGTHLTARRVQLN